MTTGKKQNSALLKEWNAVKRQERKNLEARAEKRERLVNRMLEGKVPDKLQSTLDGAFNSAFSAVFQKGTGVIEKTYNRKKREENFKINSYAAELKNDRKSLRSFSKSAARSGIANLLLSGAEGIGLGLLGIGIPDIPLFTAVILKNMYEIALSHGFEYRSGKEKYWILLLIRGALAYGEEAVSLSREADRFINDEKFMSDKKLTEGYDEKAEIMKTSKALSEELLYMKFLQGIPLAGAAGGLSDAVCLRKIQKYAVIKYRKRFLYNQAKNRQQEQELIPVSLTSDPRR